MFPSSKHISSYESTRTPELQDLTWLSNPSFKRLPQIKTQLNETIDDKRNNFTSKKSSKKRNKSIILKKDTHNKLFVLDKRKDTANMGADRTYFKDAIRFKSKYKCINNKLDNGSLRYFQNSYLQSSLKNDLHNFPQTEDISIQEWIQLWQTEQLSNLSNDHKRLKLMLSRIQSLLIRNPEKRCFQLRNIEFRLRRQLGESADDLVNEWRRDLRTSVFDHTGWMLYMNFLLSSSSHKMTHVSRDFKEYINIQLADISDNGGTYKDYENLLETLFSYALALSDAGYNEIAISLLLSVFEYNAVPDPDDRNATIECYRKFWISGRPRLGEDGYINWTTDHNTSAVIDDPTEPFIIDPDLTAPLQWLQNEVNREKAHLLPFHQLNSDLEDPDRFVKFTELFVFRIPVRAKHRLLSTIFLQLIFILGSCVLSSLSSSVMCTLIEYISPLYNIISTDTKLASRLISPVQNQLSQQYLRRLCHQLLYVKKYPDLYRTVLFIIMSLSYQDAVEILSKRRDDVELFAAFLQMYPSENNPRQLITNNIKLLIAQIDTIPNPNTIQFNLQNIDPSDFTELDSFNFKFVKALLENDSSVFSFPDSLQDNFEHVHCRRFLHYAKLAVQCKLITDREFTELCCKCIKSNRNKAFVIYDCQLLKFVFESLLRYQYNSVARQLMEQNWIAALMYLYVENDKIKAMNSCKDECSTMPPIFRMKNLLKKVIDLYPNCVLFHQLAIRFSCQFLSDVESELTFTNSRLLLPFNKSLYLDHLHWVATNCRNSSEFEWKPLIKSMEQDRNLRIKLPLVEFQELLNLYS